MWYPAGDFTLRQAKDFLWKDFLKVVRRTKYFYVDRKPTKQYGAGFFEPILLCLSWCDFLGALYSGYGCPRNEGGLSNEERMTAFIVDILGHVNPRYKGVSRDLGGAYREVVGLVIFLLALMVRPQGLFGRSGGSMTTGRNLVIGGLVALVLLLLAMLPAWTARTDILISLYITLAQSWNILTGYAGQINLGHAAFFGVGAFVMRHLWISGVHPYVGLLAGGGVALLFGLVIGVPAFRLRVAYFAIGTLGLAEILRNTVGNALPVVSTLPAEFITNYTLSTGTTWRSGSRLPPGRRCGSSRALAWA